MTFHLLAYYESLDSAVLTSIAGVADPALTVTGDNVQVPEFANLLLAGFSIGANVTRMQLQSPSIRRVNPIEISPVINAAVGGDKPIGLDYVANPKALDIGEQLLCYASEDASGASVVNGIVLLGSEDIRPVSGNEIVTVRVTSSVTCSTGNWVNGSISFSDALPVGRYAIVGAHFYGSNLLAFRFLFAGGANRPGGLATADANDHPWYYQRYGRLGIWGEFHSSTPPTVDFLAVGACTSQIGMLDLVKVG